MSKVLVITTSLRAKSNSDILAERLIAGAKDAGHEVETISLKGKKIGFCIGCLSCQKTQKCVIKDDAIEIAEKVKNADTLVFVTPIYYYEMAGQMKTLLDRLNPLYPSDYRFRKLKLTAEWDKTFPKSDKVEHGKVTFVNRYGITLAADMYVPKSVDGKLPAIAVSGPFGAVKEQCSGLYAQTMAERGYLTIAFDPSFTGESGGNVRYMASPDINTEDFMAAVDFLSLNERVDPDRIGIIGICGWGGMALNTAALDTRIKATVAVTMYDMTRVNANGYFDSEDSEDVRYQKKAAMCAQRLEDLKTGEYKLGGGVIDPLPENAPFFVKDYHDYYKTQRGYHPRSLNSNGGWNVTGCESFINQPILKYSNEIRSAVLIIHGEKAHSCYFSRDAYANMIKGSKYTENKELMIIPDTVHTDLYDGGNRNAIPFDKIDEFMKENGGSLAARTKSPTRTILTAKTRSPTL